MKNVVFDLGGVVVDWSPGQAYGGDSDGMEITLSI